MRVLDIHVVHHLLDELVILVGVVLRLDFCSCSLAVLSVLDWGDNIGCNFTNKSLGYLSPTDLASARCLLPLD
jgi:hypothetical protein